MMKSERAAGKWGGVLFCVLFALVMSVELEGASLRWKEVEQALQEAQPRTALELLPTLRSNALADRAMGDLARAIALEAQLQGTIQENPGRERIVRLAGALQSGPKEVQAPLRALLAHWYWDYFRQNQYRLLDQTRVRRSDVVNPVGLQQAAEKLEAWDLDRLFREIDSLFQESLSHSEELHSVSAASWDSLFKASGDPAKADLIRPTLFDVLAHSALEFYQAGEWAGAQPKSMVQFQADQPVYGVIPLFGTMEDFLSGKVERRAEESPEERALFLFRELLRVHLRDREVSALCELELERLDWAAQVCGVAKSAKLHKEALRKLTERWSDQASVSKVWHKLAQVLHAEGDWVASLEAARKGAAVHPRSDGAVLCRNLVNQILASELDVQTESQWVSGPAQSLSRIQVRYRNLGKVHFRLVASDFENHVGNRSRQDEKFRSGLLKQTPLHEWSQSLMETTNYQNRTENFPVPVGLKPGYYVLMACPEAEFSEVKNSISLADVVVSPLGIVGRSRAGRGEVLVVDAETGEPKVGVEVERWRLTQAGKRARSGGGKTDEWGWYRWDRLDTENQVWLRAKDGVGEAVTPMWVGPMPAQNPLHQTQVHLFTDRAIYRPGQILHYKGIVVDADPVAEKYRVKADHEVVLALFDANGQQVERRKHRSGVNGSFAGSLTLPMGRMLGAMQLRVMEGGQGEGYFRVEEYKRPKFQVKWEPLKGVVKLGDKVRVEGEAMSYTGAPVDGAEVEWHVRRRVQMPPWWGWRFSIPRAEEEEVMASGRAKTDVRGRFVIEFSARPAEDVSAEEEPVFRFEMVADVTDGTGETRGDRQVVSIGYTTFGLRAEVDEWQQVGKPVMIRVRAETHNQMPRVAKGVVEVYRVQQPERVERPMLEMGPVYPFPRRGRGVSTPVSNSNGDRWPLGERVESREFQTGTNGTVEVGMALPAGMYRAVLESVDEGGVKVHSEEEWVVLDPASDRFPVRKAFHVAAPAWRVEVGEEFEGIWGTGYSTGRCFVEVESGGRVLQRFWTDVGKTQQRVMQKVEESMRGQFVVRWTQVRDHFLHQIERRVEVPEISSQLRVKWERFVSKLEPGRTVDWTLRVEPPLQQPGGPRPELLPTEMLAVLYDASLEAFAPHSWQESLWRWGRYWKARDDGAWGQYGNQTVQVLMMLGEWPRVPFEAVEESHRDFRSDLKGGLGIVGRGGRFSTAVGAAPPASAMLALESNVARKDARMFFDAAVGGAAATPPPSEAAAQGEDATRGTAKPSQSMPRRNLVETAFFEPMLQCDSNGVVSIRFQVPDTLTEWRFMGLAHDQAARSGLLKDVAVSSKSLMIQPNPPRFLREGDEVEVTAKVNNRTDGIQKGKARLQWKEAVKGQDVNALLGMKSADGGQVFEIPPGESRVISWRIRVPESIGPLIYVVSAATDRFSDGEEGIIPVLSRRVFVTESMPLTLRGAGKQTFDFEALKSRAGKKGIETASLKVEVLSNPSWYALMALPYLMEFPHECSEQTFNRFYANILARHLVGSQPRLKGLFEAWRKSETLKSPLEKNEDVKSVVLEETPWVQEAQDETAGRRKLAELMDGGRVEYELGLALNKLRDMQLPDGRWPWFPGGPGNEHLTLYMVTGFARLEKMGVDVDGDLAKKALPALDAWMEEKYEDAQKHKPEELHLSSRMVSYLYARSFYLKDQPFSDTLKSAWDYWVDQGRKHWVKLGSVSSQAQLALALYRMGDEAGSRQIVKSLVERRIEDGEWGVCWVRKGTWAAWGESALETQALVIEMLEETSGSATLVEEAKRWLLNQKRGQHWSSTKSTSDAIYALMMRGDDWGAGESEESLRISLGGRSVIPGGKAAERPEVGTGFIAVRLPGKEVKASMAKIVVEKKKDVPSWASVHWQYWAGLDQVKSMTNNPLRVEKKLYRKRMTATGLELQPVGGNLRVGDELVVRLEIVASQDLEFIHLKDQRASGVEPVDVLSGYRGQGGLGYYQSTRDTTSHFFFDELPRGTHIIEYSARVQLRGRYLAGIAEIQSMYAPEMGGHSSAQEVVVE